METEVEAVYGRMGVGAEIVKEREGEMKKMDDEVGGDDDDVGDNCWDLGADE